MSPQCRVYMVKVIPSGGWQLNDLCVRLDSEVLCTVIILERGSICHNNL